MGDAVLTATDLSAGCTTAIAKTTPADPLDTRRQVPDLVRMKNRPIQAYGCAPAALCPRCSRGGTAIEHHGFAFCDCETRIRTAAGAGYAQIEPDVRSSWRAGGHPISGLAVVDAKGRASRRTPTGFRFARRTPNLRWLPQPARGAGSIPVRW